MRTSTAATLEGGSTAGYSQDCRQRKNYESERLKAHCKGMHTSFQNWHQGKVELKPVQRHNIAGEAGIGTH